MKKSFKRAGVAVLSMAMLLSMGAVGAMSVSAAGENYTVTASGKLTESNSTFKVYKVSDNLGNMVGTWTLPTGKTAITEYIGKAPTSADMKELAATLAGQVSGKTAVNSKGTAVGTSIALEDGYYLVIVDVSSVDTMVEPMLVQVKDGTPTAAGSTAKTQDLTLTKEITKVGTDASKATTAAENLTNKKDSTAIAGVGDTVSYKINTSMPKYSPTATTVTAPYIQDTPTNLTDDVSSIAVTLNGTKITGDDIAKYYTATASGDGFIITFKQDAVEDFGGKSILVEYEATVKNTATSGTTGNDNTAKIVYNRDYLTGNKSADDGKHVDDEAEVYTAPLTIHKTDGTNGLKDVQFTLKNSSDEYVKTDGSTTATKTEATYTTTASGAYADITYSGLKDGTYTLTEEQGVDTYRKLTGAVTITITGGKASASSLYNGTYTYAASAETADDGYVSASGSTVTISNPKINELPGTGGMGTVLFTVGGAAVVLLAGAMFVVYMRKRKVEE